MGLRHLSGLREVTGEIHVVDQKPEAETDVRRVAAEFGLDAQVYFYTALEQIPDSMNLDAAILGATAKARLESVRQVVARKITYLLIEKPLEQSRERCDEILRLVRDSGLRAKCNLYRRCLPFYSTLKEEGGPFQITVNCGASGLGCNGIHWIDFAIYLTGSKTAEMLFGEVEEAEIASGRGPSFRDYGGRALLAFEDGSRLFLSSSAMSSAPASLTIVQAARHYLIDQDGDAAIVFKRPASSTMPNYRYGADYEREEIRGIESIQLGDLTRDWIRWIEGRGQCCLPDLEEAALGHKLLFDLLETTGKTIFPFT
jgi:predicted dehydrogenase